MAYDEAKKVYGKYELVYDYGSLFETATSDDTVESIFEILSVFLLLRCLLEAPRAP